MLMNPKSLGPWCYYLALKSDCFTSHAPIQRVLELVHKPRRELKSHKTVSTCWLQGWFNSAGSESQSSIWQLFCISYSTVWTQILDWGWWSCSSTHQWQHRWYFLRATKANYCPVHHTPPGRVGTAMDSAGASEAHGLAIVPPKWHLPRQLTVPPVSPAEPSLVGFVPRAGLPPSFSPGPPHSKWEKWHVKQRCGMTFVLLTLLTLIKRKKKKKNNPKTKTEPSLCIIFALQNPLTSTNPCRLIKEAVELFPLTSAQAYNSKSYSFKWVKKYNVTSHDTHCDFKQKWT